MSESDIRLADTVLAFTPVPTGSARRDGWTPVVQERFIRALEAMGAVSPAARAVGRSRTSAYKLRERPNSESFVRAWDLASELGQARLFDIAMERALDGVTTVHIHRGGSVSVKGGPDLRLMKSALAPDVIPPAAIFRNGLTP